MAPQGKQALTNMLMQGGSHNTSTTNLKNSYERLQGVRTSTFKKNVPTIDASSGKKLLGRNRDF